MTRSFPVSKERVEAGAERDLYISHLVIGMIREKESGAKREESDCEQGEGRSRSGA